ncbi:putative transporter YycB [Paraliobacillus sp. PM-2]|uniref:CynX/NimT family MFS transporter n=1 Tax=Paraliobacillus sp. PM-2 TaxID=1462524 RepID=UPI00061C45EA|nr:MFS transporter [Paraliobacillus sp. PM-2]CQR48345.1 putative transporter YycB [Paraliobacillus sp. PM-2]
MSNRFSTRYILFTIGIILVAFNLRPAITSVGPLVGPIRDQMGLDNWNVGLITSLPLLSFAIMSPLAPKLRNRVGNELSILIGLILLFIGIITRIIPHSFPLYVGTTLVGLGIAICNVLLPGIIKEKFPNHIGTMTGIYTTCMSIFAAIASGVSVPLAKTAGLGWEYALAIWSIPTFFGLIIWFVLYRTQPKLTERDFFATTGSNLFRSFLAWQVTLYMGLQSFLFYVTISWLPEIIQAQGVSISTSGWLLSYMQFVGLPATFLAPIIAGRVKKQQSIIITLSSMAIIGYCGILLADTFIWLVLCITLIGIALGGSISLALALLGLRARHAKQSAELSGMAQSFGYLLAATGPILIGSIYDVNQSWTMPIIVILFISILMMGFGIGAARDRYV